MNHRQSTWMLLAGCLALLGLSIACSVNPVTGKRELMLISTEQEISMGLQAGPQFEAQFDGPVPDEGLQRYVSEIGMKLVANCDRKDLPYEFKCVRSAIPNAFALPGGKVFVTAGLIACMSNERQLAAVLGHEIGHVNARHNVKGMQRQMGSELFGKMVAQMASGQEADKAEKAKGAAQFVAGMVTMKYGRDDEYQADSLGIKYMARSGWNPQGMVELLEVLLAMHDKEPSSLEEMFQTHPLTSKRVAEAKETVAKDFPQAKAGEADPNVKTFDQMKAKAIQHATKL